MRSSSRCWIYLCLGHNWPALEYSWSYSLFLFYLHLRTHCIFIVDTTSLKLLPSSDFSGLNLGWLDSWRFLRVCVLYYFPLRELPRVAFQPDIFSTILVSLPIKIMPLLFSETQAAGQSETIQKWYLEGQNEH